MASFDVENYEAYVLTQAESAIRHLALSYAYDHFDEPGAAETAEVTLRSGTEQVSAALRDELQQRFAQAGIVVVDAKLTHLAYAPEIAGTMLRRQQAEAVIAARSKIVAGAVGMVEMALHGLAERGLVQLDDERRAAMVSNLLVVLCSDHDAQPVVNTGTLYT
jgi:regulator of protease activity HflC (stomatin/prohibitin superfamily)